MSKGLKIFLWVAVIIIIVIILVLNWERWFGSSNNNNSNQSDENKTTGNNEEVNNSEKKYIVSTLRGAIVYVYDNDVFMAPENPQMLPYNTEIKINSISADKKYAGTEYGWISVTDISVV